MLTSTGLSNKDDRGFSLVELMMVVLIISILIAVAVPAFMGATNRARERAVEQNVRNALTSSRAAGSDASGYADLVLADFPIQEQSLIWLDGATSSATPKEISVSIDQTNEVVTLAALGESGDCFMIRDWSDKDPGVEFAQVSMASGVACKGDSGTNGAVSWSDGW